MFDRKKSLKKPLQISENQIKMKYTRILFPSMISTNIVIKILFYSILGIIKKSMCVNFTELRVHATATTMGLSEII